MGTDMSSAEIAKVAQTFQKTIYCDSRCLHFGKGLVNWTNGEGARLGQVASTNSDGLSRWIMPSPYLETRREHKLTSS